MNAWYKDRDRTGAVETVRALGRLHRPYEDCTAATQTVQAQLILYERYGNCTGAVERARAETVRVLWRVLALYGECTGAVETVRALRRLHRRYKDCTAGTQTVQAQLILYERYGNCAGAMESACALRKVYRCWRLTCDRETARVLRRPYGCYADYVGAVFQIFETTCSNHNVYKDARLKEELNALDILRVFSKASRRVDTCASSILLR